MTFLPSVRPRAGHLFATMAGAVLTLAGLTGCGTRVDCTSPEVEDLMIEVLNTRHTDERLRVAFADVSLRNIVIESVDDDVGRYACSGDLVYTPSDGEELVRRITYGVQPVQNSDDDFQLTYDEDAVYSFEFRLARRIGVI